MATITVYMPSFNCSQYIEKAIESVLSQTMGDWELIIINDGSTDNTEEILKKYTKHPQIFTVNQENRGLNITNNIAIRLSRGKYIMRLDADDFLDENALVVLSTILDTKPEVGLVYPDYYEVDQSGKLINLVRRKKVFEEVELLDLPAHGACTMFRKEYLLEIGGYAEEFSCQDGYDIWIKFIQKYKPYNVNIPLFYYRQHPDSLTKDCRKILDTRCRIKRKFVKQQLNGKKLIVLGIIPVVSDSIHYRNPFQKLAGRFLIDFTLDEAIKADLLDRIVLAADSDEVIDYVAGKHKQILSVKRLPELSGSTIRMHQVINFVLDVMKHEYQYIPDAVCALYITTPLRKAKHINHAVDTMNIFDAESIISVEEELSNYYHHKRFGLEPVEHNRNIRMEKNAIFKENGAIYLSKAEVFKKGKLIGQQLGHITMLPEESIKINSAFDLWIAEKIIEERADKANI